MEDAPPTYTFDKAWAIEPAGIFLGLKRVVIIDGNPHRSKLYVHWNLDRNQFTIRATSEKLEAVVSGKNYLTTLKKCLKGARVTGYFSDKNCTSLRFEGSLGRFELMVSGKPPAIELISAEGESLFRTGTEGSFTKRRPAQYRPNYTDRLPAWLVDSAEESINKEADQTTTRSLRQRTLRSKLKRKLKTWEKAYGRIHVPTPEEIEASALAAEALKRCLYLVRDDMTHIELSPDQTGLASHVSIDLDPDISPAGNLEAYYRNLKKQRRALDSGATYRAKVRKNIDALKVALERLTTSDRSDDELAAYESQFGLSPKNRIRPGSSHQTSTAEPFRTFTSQTGHRILVGKGPRDNDTMTKQAKPGDLWFHVVGATGSHVIVPWKKNMESCRETIVREAAILALHFSKIRGDLSGEVYVTTKDSIRKRKGMAPGLWNVENAKSQFFRYEPEELRALLNRPRPDLKI